MVPRPSLGERRREEMTLRYVFFIIPSFFLYFRMMFPKVRKIWFLGTQACENLFVSQRDTRNGGKEGIQRD